MTHTRERLDPRAYDAAADQGSYDRDLMESDRKAVSVALYALRPPMPWGPIVLWGALILGLIVYVTWLFWQQVIEWLA